MKSDLTLKLKNEFEERNKLKGKIAKIAEKKDPSQKSNDESEGLKI